MYVRQIPFACAAACLACQAQQASQTSPCEGDASLAVPPGIGIVAGPSGATASMTAFDARFGTATSFIGTGLGGNVDNVRIVDVVLSSTPDACPSPWLKNQSTWSSRDLKLAAIELWIPINAPVVGPQVIDQLNALEISIYTANNDKSVSRLANSGEVDITDFEDGIRIAGTFAVQFDEGPLSGSFDVPFCTTACR